MTHSSSVSVLDRLVFVLPCNSLSRVVEFLFFPDTQRVCSVIKDKYNWDPVELLVEQILKTFSLSIKK